MKRFLLLIVVLLGSVNISYGQYDAQFSQYWMAMGYYNPAVAGASDNLNLFALHRQQWVGIKGAPKSFFVSADMPVTFGKSIFGIGVIGFTESIGLFRNTHVAGQFAYKKKLFGGTLSFGLQAGMVNQAFDGTKVDIPESEFHTGTDEGIPTTQVEAMTVDINAGIYFTHKNFYGGLASTHISEPELALDENVYTFIGRAYNLTGGYNIQLWNPLYELQPSVFLKTDLQSFQADITARVLYNKMFSGGLSWRVNESVVLSVGAIIGGFHVGYAYDFPTTAILKGSTGSHELMVRYKLKLNKIKTGKNKHKSVRIL
ncbi:MAG: type IX secretion system membrane protein PorP/SprF [Parabacteroides sp.]|jgi:type IX secretion system PorP/SprF family membrane protein|nr:type IX secretion system membrane protein PorP/SprF [Parabacteroides sp.]